MDHDLTTAPDPGAATAGPGTTVRLASPGSVVASIPLLFGFHPDNSLVILGIGRSASGGRLIRHGVRIDLAEIRGRERAAALELAGRLRDHDAEIAILVAFGPRGATGAKARPDHCRKLMAAFRAQIEAAPTEERVTVVDAIYTCNGRWWSYMCRNTRCCPSVGTPVPAEAPAGLSTALSARGHTVFPSREALDATLAPYPPEVLARTAAAAEALDPTWYDSDAGLASVRRLMDSLLLRCGDSATSTTSTTSTASTAGRSPVPDDGVGAGSGAGSGSGARAVAMRGAPAAVSATAVVATEGDSVVSETTGPARRRSRAAAAESPRRRGLSATISIEGAAAGMPGSRSQAPDAAAARHTGRRRTSPAAAIPAPAGSCARVVAADSPRSTRRGTSATADVAAIPGARSGSRGHRAPEPEAAAGEQPAEGTTLISDAEAAQLLVALRNWRVRDYLACAAATEDSAERLLRLCTELARRAPHPDLRLAPYALAAWAAWAIGRPSVAQCAVDRALAIDPEYKFASLIRAGLHHAIDGEGVRESAANTRRDLFGEADLDGDLDLKVRLDVDLAVDPEAESTPDLGPAPDRDSGPAPVPSQRSTESTPGT